uniref:dual-specificity kinase n=1 Tax=Graphocephala atropunctata TaxID=36148 RepID=A0A1B6LAH5_9HEMI
MLRDSGYCETAGSEGEREGGLLPVIPVPPVMAADGVGPDKDNRITGSSCRALRHAVASLNRLDDFILEKIGSGFFSEVFKVTHRVTGQVMVLKMNLLRSNRHNMLKEVQLMNQLCHKNILGFMGVCVHEGQLHALTEFINGGSLEQLIQARNIELSYRSRIKLALDIARGMEYLHSRDVFHRDLTSKNVLIKKDEVTGDMSAVVGDFGLAAKIPRSGYRLPTVGSPYWMSPECLKGQWYDERSDVFSYGIILCELIARVEADPDILPRTENFGLDYLAFVELCTDPPPPDFLKLAFNCCNYEPKNRPQFGEVVTLLETMLTPACLLPAVPCPPASIAARSEEFLPTTMLAAPTHPANLSRKVIHRRSLSEDVGMLVFPPHLAPSEKARCHLMLTRPSLKHLGETMAKNDPHYKPFPSKANPFAALSQFKGVKKILASTNSTDLFSSCFELPSPSPYRTKPFELMPANNRKQEPKPPFERGKMFEEEGLRKDTLYEQSVLLEPVVKPLQIISKTKLDSAVSKLECSVLSDQSKKKESSPVSHSSLEEDNFTVKTPASSSVNKAEPRYCTVLKAKPRSLPSSPTFLRRNTVPVVSSELFVRLNTRKNQVLSKYSGEEDSIQRIVCDVVRKRSSLYNHPLFKTPSSNPPSGDTKTSPTSLQHPLRSCASSSNLVCLPDSVFQSGVTPVISLRRRGSCESGFFSSVGEDFCLPGIELVTASSVTLSSSSAASSLFLDSGATVSCSLDDIATPLRGHAHLPTHCHKRSSSIYTDSSEDVSSLGGGDLPTWDDRGSQAPQNISKIVEYFERKQVCGSVASCSKWEAGDVPSPNLTQHYQLQREYYQLRRSYLPPARRNINHRLLVCEGAVKSKLQLFDKK